MASTYLSRTMGTPTDATKQTLSVWIKFSANSDYGGIVTSQYDSLVGGSGHWTGNSESIYSLWTTNGSNNVDTRTSALGRDFSGWYHIVSTQDASQSGTDKSKIWINGVLQTGFENDNRSNFSTHANWFANGKPLQIGRKFNDSLYFNGIMSHLHLCDGYAYQASDFGSFDSATGEWKINTAPNVNYGNEGFFILKDNAGTVDLSGNGNNFSVGGGTILSVKDCPSNVFATLNPLNVPTSNAPAFSLGNTKTITMNVDPGYFGGTSTLGASSGKYYCEIKITDNNGTGNVGITFDPSEKARQGTNFSAQISNSFVYANTGKQYSSATGTSGASYGDTYTDNDIIGIAMDLDNSKLYFHKNGTYQNSGVPTSGSTGTGAISITAGETYFFYLSDVGGNTTTYECNFGNGFFGTTAVSSAGTNASNNGVFEYDVPTGYTALSTKGLNL